MMPLDCLQEIVKDKEDCYAAVQGITKSQTELIYWTTWLPGFDDHQRGQACTVGRECRTGKWKSEGHGFLNETGQEI